MIVYIISNTVGRVGLEKSDNKYYMVLDSDYGYLDKIRVSETFSKAFIEEFKIDEGLLDD